MSNLRVFGTAAVSVALGILLAFAIVSMSGCADSGGRGPGGTHMDRFAMDGIKVWMPRDWTKTRKTLLEESIRYQEDFLSPLYPPAVFEVVLRASRRGLDHEGYVEFDLVHNRVYVWIGRDDEAPGYAHARTHWAYIAPQGPGLPGDLDHVDPDWGLHRVNAVNALAGVYSNR